MGFYKNYPVKDNSELQQDHLASLRLCCPVPKTLAGPYVPGPLGPRGVSQLMKEEREF
jgi:hypothetical protein